MRPSGGLFPILSFVLLLPISGTLVTGILKQKPMSPSIEAITISIVASVIATVVLYREGTTSGILSLLLLSSLLPLTSSLFPVETQQLSYAIPAASCLFGAMLRRQPIVSFSLGSISVLFLSFIGAWHAVAIAIVFFVASAIIIELANFVGLVVEPALQGIKVDSQKLVALLLIFCIVVVLFGLSYYAIAGMNSVVPSVRVNGNDHLDFSLFECFEISARAINGNIPTIIEQNPLMTWVAIVESIAGIFLFVLFIRYLLQRNGKVQGPPGNKGGEDE